MNNKDNSKVPIAILSCFLIAFILQGILKISGVFIFEKALNWDIFEIIDSCFWAQVIFYSFIVFIVVYCLSFTMTSRAYTDKWYHYLIIIIPVNIITYIRWVRIIDIRLDILFDIILYIIIPFIINLTTQNKYRLFKRDLFGIILTLSIQIILYFCYLGLKFWSSLLTSILILNTITVPVSTHFLIQIEVYIGLIGAMLSMNMLIKYIKRRLKND